MISLFNSIASKSDLIETNGDYILDMICTSAIITEELNGEYSFDGVFRISDTFPKSLYDALVEESILKVTEEYGIEYFRIAKVIKTNKNITVFARHITISDILTLWCEDVRPENQNGAGAITWIYNNSIGNKLLTVNSDIAETNTSYFINKNVYECLFTADNSFLDRWGGEVYRRGLNLSINKRVGVDRGVTIRSKKNLTGFEATTNIDTLITRIYPKGYDGITIEEKYIDSKYINNYARIYSKEVKFDDIKVNGESVDDGFETLAEAQEELKRRVKQMYEVDKVDILTASYRVNFVELGKTEEYKNYSILEKTWTGDTVEVIEDTLGVNISVRVLKRKFDVLKNKRTETELSDKNIKEKPPTIQQIVTELEKIPTVDNFLQIAKDQATSVLNAGINGYVVVNKNEILIMDTSDKNTATKVWRFNVNGLGYSNTGYYGQYGTAITMEGSIVADFINVGILNAGLIKAGVLSSFNSRTWINMETGTFNFANKIKFDGEIFDIDLSSKDLATNTQLQALAGEVSTKISTIDAESLVTQTANDITFKFSQVGYNVFKDGQFKNGLNSVFEYEYDFNGINKSRGYITPQGSEWCLDGRNCLQLKASNSTTGQYGVGQTLKLKKNCTYNFNGFSAAHRCNYFVFLQKHSTGEVYFITEGNAVGGNLEENWNNWSANYTTDNVDTNYSLFLALNNCGEDGYAWFTDIMVSEGEIKNKFNPNPDEVYNSMTTIDNTGLTVKNGAIKIKNNFNNDVMWCNSEGWLTTANLFINGDENPSNLEIGGSDGNKGVGIRTNGAGYSAYLDFGVLDRNATFDENVASGQYHRFITEASDRSTLNLVTSNFNIRHFTGYGDTKLTVQGYLEVFNNISTQHGITATGRVTAGGYSLTNGDTLVSSNTVASINYANYGKSYLEIATPNLGIWGADLWASDEKLKENIKEINVNEELGISILNYENKIGLDLIENLKHYSFDYKENYGGSHVECGYIAQDLQELNENLVLEIKQEDGTTILQPLASTIIPNLSLAIQEQQILIKQLKTEIESLKAIIN